MRAPRTRRGRRDLGRGHDLVASDDSENLSHRKSVSDKTKVPPGASTAGPNPRRSPERRARGVRARAAASATYASRAPVPSRGFQRAVSPPASTRSTSTTTAAKAMPSSWLALFLRRCCSASSTFARDNARSKAWLRAFSAPTRLRAPRLSASYRSSRSANVAASRCAELCSASNLALASRSARAPLRPGCSAFFGRRRR